METRGLSKFKSRSQGSPEWRAIQKLTGDMGVFSTPIISLADVVSASKMTSGSFRKALCSYLTIGGGQGMPECEMRYLTSRR